jgi:MinD superfamily P-loop ATPase
VLRGVQDDVQVISGVLNMGEEHGVPIIEQTKKRANKETAAKVPKGILQRLCSCFSYL